MEQPSLTFVRISRDHRLQRLTLLMVLQPMGGMRGIQAKLPLFIYAAILAAMCSGTDAYAAIIPDCTGRVEIDSARVVRVEKNGVLVLDDGRAIILEGIRLPEQEDQREEALSALRALTVNKSVTFTATAPKQDRYDRVRVQAFTQTSWLQRSLLEQGLARVSIAPDRRECAAALYGFEAAARNARRGIWASAAYRVRGDRDDWRQDIGSFQVIEGRIGRVTIRDDRIVLDFGSDGRTGLVGVVTGDDRRIFRQAGNPMDWEGRRVRIRGMVQEAGGRPQIALGSAAQLEVLN